VAAGSVPDAHGIVDTTFPYEPPFAPGDPVPTFQFNVTHSGATSSSASVQNEYTVGLTAEFKSDFLGALEATMKMQGKWIWTDGSAVSTSTGTSETATVTVGGPAYGYTYAVGAAEEVDIDVP
jgi:hypothetical protein